MSSTTLKRKQPEGIIHFTSRNPTWTYLHLQLITHPPSKTSLDPLTAKSYLTAALSQFLGLTGSAIPIDILKIDGSAGTQTQTVWIRVPCPDAPAVVVALSSWIGGSERSQAGNVAWRVCARGNFLDAVVRGGGGDLFISL